MNDIDIEKIRTIAVASAFHAGKELMKRFGKTHDIQKKGDIDLVTEADLSSEEIIKHMISSVFPNHSILAEESGIETKQNSPFQWIIDPLDGTTNYAHHIPIFCVSIAFAVENVPICGVVFNPYTEEMFIGIKNRQATLNGIPIKVSQTSQMKDSLLVTGFPYNLHSILPSLLNRFSACIQKSQGVRRLGSAALDLCFVACGRFEGFWEQNLNPWDTAAGVVIVQEAGGKLSNFANQPYSIDQKEIVASNQLIHDELIRLL